MRHHSVRETTQCRICHSKDIIIALELKSSPLSDEYLKKKESQEKYKLECLLCKDCGQFQLKQIVSPEHIYTDYIYWSSSSPGLKNHFANYCDMVTNYLKMNNGLILDIGCNEGLLLENFSSKGFNICGVEPANNICDHLSNTGIPHFNNYMTKDVSKKIVKKYGSPDIITTNNVFANVDNTDEFMEAVESIMDDHSVFIIEAGYLLDMISNRVFDNIYHEHLSYFSLHSLSKLMERFSLEIFHAVRIDTKGGSIRIFIQKKTGSRPIDTSVSGLLKEEENKQLFSIKTYREFNDEINLVGKQLRNFLKKQKENGMKIAGYGASATVTTVLHHFDIGDFFDFLVDDNPIKQGTFSPGYGIPVHSPNALNEESADIIVILPWRFADMIIEKNKELLCKGFSIVKFLPYLEVIDNTQSKQLL